MLLLDESRRFSSLVSIWDCLCSFRICLPLASHGGTLFCSHRAPLWLVSDTAFIGPITASLASKAAFIGTWGCLHWQFPLAALDGRRRPKRILRFTIYYHGLSKYLWMVSSGPEGTFYGTCGLTTYLKVSTTSHGCSMDSDRETWYWFYGSVSWMGFNLR